MTVIEGLRLGNGEMHELCTKLKRKFAVGGTYKDGKIMVQGDHREYLPKVLAESGFASANIEVL